MNLPAQPIIRLIQPADNAVVKALVLDTLAEFGLFGEGYAGVDPELDDMYQAYADGWSDYFVVDVAGRVAGVGGYAPLAGTVPGEVAELRKMYFNATLRGCGMGQKMLDLCLSEARKKGYQSMYLETVPGMKVAQTLYLKNGFSYLKHRMGNTGHSNCGVHMHKILNA